MKIIITFALSMLLAVSFTHAETASSESIKKLMEKTGAGNLGEQMFNQMMPTLKKMIPNASDQFWKNFSKQINSKTIIDQTIPIYQKHLSQKEIDAINVFYDTPAGKKLIAAQPHISRASMEIGQAWGQKIAEDAIKQFKASR